MLTISLAAGLTLWYVTPAGLGLTNDSAAYIGGARSILAGSGYSDIWLDSSLEPVTHYPPLLSLALSGIGLLGLDPYRGARVLHIFLFAANTALVGLLGARMTKSSLAAIFLSLLFASNAQLLKIHAYVLSEPLFLFFSLSAFLFFDFALAAPQGSRFTRYLLIITGFLTGLAFLSRYSGLALIATFVLALFLSYPHWRTRFVKIAQFLAGAVPPIAVWFTRNALVAETATNRSFQFHPILWSNVELGFYNLSEFLMPFEPWRRILMRSGWLPWLLLALGLLLLAWLLVRAWKLFFHAESSTSPLVFATGLYAFGYLGAVLFSMSFFDASTKFQHRILSPLYLAWMLLAAWVFFRVRDYLPSLGKNRVWAVVPVALLMLGFSLLGFQQTVLVLRESGQGYASWKWRDSMIMSRLEALPADVVVYTNTPPAVYLVAGRASRVIPTRIDPVDNLPRGNYEQDLAEMRAELLSGQAVLALFDTSGIEDALGAENFAAFIDGLVVLEKAQGDSLYGKP